MSKGDLADELLGIIGENDEHSKPRGYLDTGFPPLNKAISGDYKLGFPTGRMVEMFGPPSSGKTAIATAAMVNAQKAGGIAVFMDHERSFDMDLAKGMGLTEKAWVYKQPRTFEESLDMAVTLITTVREKKLIAEDAPIIIVYDSLASMIPKSKADKNSADFNMNDTTALARATSAAFPALALFAEENNTLMLFLNQSRTKIGVMFGDPTTTPGGAAPEFYASVRIKLSRSMMKKDLKGGGKETIGQRIGAECVKNKINRPFLKASWDFIYREDGSGFFDVKGSLIDYLVEQGTLKKGGAHIEWNGKKLHRAKLIETATEEELVALL